MPFENHHWAQWSIKYFFKLNLHLLSWLWACFQFSFADWYSNTAFVRGNGQTKWSFIGNILLFGCPKVTICTNMAMHQQNLGLNDISHLR